MNNFTDFDFINYFQFFSKIDSTVHKKEVILLKNYFSQTSKRIFGLPKKTQFDSIRNSPGLEIKLNYTLNYSQFRRKKIKNIL